MISRLSFAGAVAEGRVVLDVGGRLMPTSDEKFPKFARAYAAIRARAKAYRIVDVQRDPQVDYSIDLNTRAGVARLAAVLEDYRPEVVLCMETLEHINYHYEVMNILAAAIANWAAMCLITLPNNGNWIVNRLMMGTNDHSTAFFKNVARKFVSSSDLGQQAVLMFPCTGMYIWYWPIAYALAGFQPTSWGFLAGPKQGNPAFTALAARLPAGG